jgi:hypothetical protein
VARGLVLISVVAFAVSGALMVIVPAAMLGVVGVPSDSTSEFLLRTQGVALLFGAIVLWAVRDARPPAMRIVLLGLAGYYVLSATVDLAAYSEQLVGTTSLPSAAVRIVLGLACVVAIGRT